MSYLQGQTEFSNKSEQGRSSAKIQHAKIASTDERICRTHSGRNSIHSCRDGQQPQSANLSTYSTGLPQQPKPTNFSNQSTRVPRNSTNSESDPPSAPTGLQPKVHRSTSYPGSGRPHRRPPNSIPCTELLRGIDPRRCSQDINDHPVQGPQRAGTDFTRSTSQNPLPTTKGTLQEITPQDQTLCSKFLQINLNNSRVATALSRKTANDIGADILLMQEPHLTDGRITGLSATWNVAYSLHKKVAIAIHNNHANPLVTSRAFHHITMRIATSLGNMDITSIYVSPSMDLADALNDLPVSNHDARHKIIAGDVNAKSPFWGCRVEDGRGRQINHLAAINWLIPANNPEAGPTCVTYRENGWPDVTLVSAQIAQNINDWTVLETESASDHKYITYTLKAQAFPPSSKGLYKTKYGGHSKLCKLLEPEIPVLQQKLDKVVNADQLDDLSQKLIVTIQAACNKTFKKLNNKRHNTGTWWTSQLIAEQNQLKALRRRFAKTNNQ